MTLTASGRWPPLPLDAWRDTYGTLHMWTQVVGKICLALTPRVNHFWNVTLHVTPRGLATPPIPYRERTFTMTFDFIVHQLVIQCSDGESAAIELAPQTVADFYQRLMDVLHRLGIEVRIWTMPVEVADPIRFEQDVRHRAYDPAWANAFWRVLATVEPVFTAFRSGFVGKSSPVHFFWGSFDLAVTRFSGRRAPLHPGGVPHLPDAVAQEAYSHEVSSAGFWPGNEVIPYPAFYAYAYPEPPGFAQASIRPADSFYSDDLHEYILPYDAVRNAENPERALMDFLMSTYDAAASLGKWDRAALDCAIDVPGKPRAIGA